MRRLIFFLWGMLLLVTVPAAAERLSVGEGRALQWDLPSNQWVLLREAPDFLVEEAAEHMGHELAAQGRQVEKEGLMEAARKRLAANEGYVCRVESGACLIVDFSPLKENETSPRDRTVGLSARYAAEGLAEEEGIENLHQQSRKIRLPGAESAYRIDARYTQHGNPKQFVGIVGFSHPDWFYLYYTDPLRNEQDLQDMERALGSAQIVRTP